MDSIERLTALFGGGPQAAFVAVLLFACGALFLALMRANRAHLQTALSAIPVMTKLEETLARSTRATEEAVEQAKRSHAIFDALEDRQLADFITGIAKKSGPPSTGSTGGE